ncbi:MAG TPA: ROK family protein [Candidatus Jeotgalibaca pullicola]|nr:ROK family protein [Candidatus Jeotgalibaca pullicola]
MQIAVFDIGGTAVKYAVWSQEEGLTNQSKFPTPETWEEMKETLKGTFQLLKEKTGAFVGAAFSCPGAVDTVEGVIRGISAVPYIHHIPLREELTKLLGVPVSIENDANCAALAELWQGAASNIQNALFFVIGSGIGGAVIINRELVKGKNLFGGEFGYMLLEENKTLSDLASPVRAANEYQEELGIDQAISGKMLFERAEEGEELAQRYVSRLKTSLARGIQLLLVAFNPDKVIIGGGISSREDLISDVSVLVNQYLEKTKATDVRAEIVACHFLNDANLLGAVASFANQTKQMKLK